MASPLLRGAAEGAATRLFDAGMIPHNMRGPLSQVPLEHILGNSSRLEHGKMQQLKYGAFKFPMIPFGAPTTVIPVAFPLTRAPPPTSDVLKEQTQLVAVFIIALVVWMLPITCINQRFCPVIIRRFMSRRVGSYFCIGLIINLTIISIYIASARHIDANNLFFALVTLTEKLTDQMEKVLVQCGAFAALCLVWVFRKKITQIMGFDQEVVKASLRDVLTGFSMKRFRPIEISLWKADGLPTGFSSNTLFTRVTLGYNEAQHTRTHDGQRDKFVPKERVTMNYDPEDDTQKMSIVIKKQEFIGATVNQLLPAAGAVGGALAGMTTPLGPGPGAALGVVTGTGAANSVGAEVARVDLSSAMINRMRERFHNDTAPAPTSERNSHRATDTSTGQGHRWIEEYYQQVDLLPQGFLWLRIADIQD